MTTIKENKENPSFKLECAIRSIKKREPPEGSINADEIGDEEGLRTALAIAISDLVDEINQLKERVAELEGRS